MKNICLLGASGSIGKQSVDVIKRHPHLFSLVAASVNESIEYLEYLVNEFPSLYNLINSWVSICGILSFLSFKTMRCAC